MMSRLSRTRSRQARQKGTPHAAGRIRIIAGRWRGRFIDVPDRQGLRPTPNRVRETLFNWLRNDIAGARCLDLFAGSGALGLEALSRGVAEVTFVDSAPQLITALRAQLAGFDATAELVCSKAEDFVAARSDRFDVVFVDPPFSLDASAICNAAGGLLNDRGVLYCERDASDELPELDWGEWERTAQAGGVKFGLARLHAD
jgi:16S rRNA (guanine966-N2)-methyltransferase